MPASNFSSAEWHFVYLWIHNNIFAFIPRMASSDSSCLESISSDNPVG